MVKKTFTLRVDVESNKGIKTGIPKLLDLLKKYDLKASFYLTMGGESNLLDLLKYKKNLTSAGERKIKIWSLKEKLRMALLPKDFVKNNKKVLKRIINEGHELGIHGYKHRVWTRGLEKIDFKKHIIKAKKKFFDLFGFYPTSWSSPGWNTNKKVIQELEKQEIKFISDFEGENVSKINGLKNVPITINGKNKMPIIEYLTGKGYSDKEIIDYMKNKISKSVVCSFYIHDMYEPIFKLNVLEEVFKLVKQKKLINKRIIDYK